VELYLLRHADAGDPAAWKGPDDDRPLSEKGLRQAERLAVHLHRIGFRPGAIVTSPRARARQTAEIVGAAVGSGARIDDRLGGSLDLGVLSDLIRAAGSPERVVLVGHDPDFSELLSTLAGGGPISMKKAALARLDVRGDLRPGGAELRWLLPPDVLPRD
jgi:phosphohistidine phosphatase